MANACVLKRFQELFLVYPSVNWKGWSETGENEMGRRISCDKGEIYWQVALRSLLLSTPIFCSLWGPDQLSSA